MRRWICSLFLGLVMTTGLLSAALAGQGLIYSVQRGDGPQSFLVGTMHSEDERVTGLLAQFGPLIAEVDTVVVELVPDAVTMLALAAATLLPLDQSLSGIVGDDRFEALRRAAVPRGLSIEMLDRLKPWAAAVTLGMPDTQTGRFLDWEIYLRAQKLQKTVLGLETAAEQLEAFDRMPMDVQLLLLDTMVKNADQMPKQLEELTAVYLQGDLAAIEQLARAQYDLMPAQIRHWFDEQLLDLRNERMIRRMREMLEKERLLVAVGALHLAGESGLVVGLRRLGYHVERWP